MLKVPLKEIERRLGLEEKYLKHLGKNWLSKEEQREQEEYAGGDVTNAMRSRLEKHHIRVDRPDRLFVYVNLPKGIVTTWPGEEIGKITMEGYPYRGNMGDERINITVNIFGTKYTGTYFKSAGDYARLRKVK